MRTIKLEELKASDLKHYQRIMAVTTDSAYCLELWDSKRLPPFVSADSHAPLSPGDLYIEVSSLDDVGIAAAKEKISVLDDFPQSRIVN